MKGQFSIFMPPSIKDRGHIVFGLCERDFESFTYPQSKHVSGVRKNRLIETFLLSTFIYWLRNKRSNLSGDRFPTMWFVRPAKAQTSQQIRLC